MSLLFWNARGLGSPQAFRRLYNLVQSHKPQMVFLTETKMCGSRMNSIKIQLGFQNCFSVDCCGRSGGLSLFWSAEIGFSLLSFSKNHIDGWVDWDSKNWRFTGFYGNPQTELRYLSWALLKNLCGNTSTPWLVGGDFNGILFQHEKQGGRDKSEAELNDFRASLDDCGLMDVGFTGDIFTWTNERPGEENVKERLDRICVTEGWKDLFPDCSIDHLPFNRSDHRPILLTLVRFTGLRGARRGRIHRFEEAWNRLPECSEIVICQVGRRNCFRWVVKKFC